MTTLIKKAVFPVAGLGTRFLPATKANPKEMLPIVDKPLIQYAVEEAVKAGITQLIFVTSSSKRAIEDHFDSNYELEAKLEQLGRHDLLSIVQNIIPSGVSCVYVRQAKPLGLGHAVLCAKDLVGNESFAVLLADDLIEEGSDGCLKEMLSRHFEKTHPSSIIAVEHIQPE
jgi:UTP--glucose-1-phosphate uridylyltransferase